MEHRHLLLSYGVILLVQLGYLLSMLRSASRSDRESRR